MLDIVVDSREIAIVIVDVYFNDIHQGFIIRGNAVLVNFTDPTYIIN